VTGSTSRRPPATLNTKVEQLRSQEEATVSMVLVSTSGGEVEVDTLQVKAARLLELFGGNKAEMARHFGVTRAQPGRWISGTDRPTLRDERRMVDLEWVWDRLVSETTVEVARGWLTHHNAFLGTAPVAALADGSAGEVVAAWDAEQAGSYA
jgi:hypothetical protein